MSTASAPDSGTSHWPLVLAGPMPRRVEPDAVSVFVACARPRAVRLALHAGTEPGPGTVLHEQESSTVALGRSLHVAVVTARPPAPLPPGRVYGYDLRFGRPGWAPADDLPADADLGSLGLLDRLGYAPGQLPSVVLPPDRLDRVRLVHGSCRKPQGGRRDALATLDLILRATHSDPDARPQQLFLTGDQIYADDVDPAVLTVAGSVGRAALGWSRPEQVPDLTDDFELAPTRRDRLVRRRGGFTGKHLHSHLVSLAEFYGIYLLAWSDVLWPRDSAGAPTLPPPDAVLDDARWRRPAHRRGYRRARQLIEHSRPDVLEFVRTMPQVRRALANVATYMILDDHDVTDDWNLHRQWTRTVHGRPLGRRIVQNALASYAVFQGWGNDPAQFAPDQPGGALLAALATWDGRDGAAAEAIAARVGLPTAAPAIPVRWDYAVDTPSYQAIVLDTRTQRGFRAGGTGRTAPALLSGPAMERQLSRRLADRRRAVPVTVVVSAAPVFGHPLIEVWVQLKKVKAIEWFEHGPAAVDREAWSLDRPAFDSLLARLAPFGRVVLLSGDVHYGFAGSVGYRDARGAARFVQLTSSALKGEDHRTRLVGGVPTVRRVPAILGAQVERVLALLTTPPARSVTRPDASYLIDFRPDPGGEPAVSGRSAAAHRRAVERRAEFGWSLMNCIVGRNNLGDVEFLRSGPDRDTPDLVRQSLWFDKTSIRSGGEPERLPYTVYDLPLDP